jgi:hypothetical protein
MNWQTKKKAKKGKDGRIFAPIRAPRNLIAADSGLIPPRAPRRPQQQTA